MKWLILILGISANASASALIKLAILPPRKLPSLENPWTLLSNWPLWLGLCMYGAAFVLYAAALARMPLNVAHPILTAGSIASVALISAFCFRETFFWTTTVGIVLIIIGVTLITVRTA